MRYVLIRLKKRRSTAALHNASESAFRMTATFWSAAVFCRFWIVESLLRELIPPIPKPNVGLRSKTSLNKNEPRPSDSDYLTERSKKRLHLGLLANGETHVVRQGRE